VKRAVKKVVAKAGDGAIHDDEVKRTVKKIVKKAVKEAVKEVTQGAVA
jgi:histone H3/H4